MTLEQDIQHWDQSEPLTPEVILKNRVRWNRNMFQMLSEEYSKAAFREMQLLGQMRAVIWDLGELKAPTDGLKPNIVKGTCRFWNGCKPWSK